MKCTGCGGIPTKGLFGVPIISTDNKVIGVESPSLCPDCLWDWLVIDFGGFCNGCLRKIAKVVRDGSPLPASIEGCSEPACLNGPS